MPVDYDLTTSGQLRPRHSNLNVLHRRSACNRTLRAEISERYEDKEQDRTRVRSDRVSR
jgi:hypothetical protein